jgi:Mg2+/citrate symporter
MNALAILGCATIAAFLLLVAFSRTPVITALVLAPVVAAAAAGGFSRQAISFAVNHGVFGSVGNVESAARRI